jgi:hypothetical protein
MKEGYKMESNIAAKVYSNKGEMIKPFRAPNKFPNTEEQEKELFDYYKEQVRLDKEIDINEVDKIVCYSFVNPTNKIIFKRNKSGWIKEIKDN